MADLAAEEPLNRRLVLARPGQQFVGLERARWGELIQPAPEEISACRGGLRFPYEDLAARGVTRTCWSIHQLTPTVDSGPVLGRSPPVEVGNARGGLPAEPLLVYDKLMPPVGWLTLRLLDALADRHARGEKGPISQLELANSMPIALREALLQPVTADRHAEVLPVSDAATLGILGAPSAAA
jgi:hypothetical protein